MARRGAPPADRLLARRLGRIRFLVGTTLVLLAAATALGVALAGRLTTGTDEGLASAQSTLDQAAQLATTLSDVSSRIADLSSTVGQGVGQTGQVLEATGSLTGSVRRLVEIVAPLSKNLTDVSAELATTEATLQQLRTQIGSTQQQVASAAPDLQRATQSLKDLPRRLTAERNRLGKGRTRLSPLLGLLRVALVVGALVVAGIALSVERTASLAVLAARQARQAQYVAAQFPPP